MRNWKQIVDIVLAIVRGVAIVTVFAVMGLVIHFNPPSLHVNLNPDINRHLDNHDCGCGGCSIDYPLPDTGDLL